MLPRAFRLFVSSTFSDMAEERTILQNDVFPELEVYCANRGFSFQAIDLRWGITEEAQLNQKTLDLCIREVSESRAHPRPNFLILSGERYGWVPLPRIITEKDFVKIKSHLYKSEQIVNSDVISKWYQLDENCVPAAFVLQGRYGIGRQSFQPYEKWLEEESKLRAILQEVVTAIRLDSREVYFLSATEQEVIAGIPGFSTTAENIYSNAPCSENHQILMEDIYAVLRSVKPCEDKKSSDFFELGGVAAERVEKFRNRLFTFLPNEQLIPLTASLATFNNGGFDSEYKKQFKFMVITKLKNAITKQIDTLAEKYSSPVSIENEEHLTFRDNRARIFFGRDDLFKAINTYIVSPNDAPFIISGLSGAGKSAFIAKLSTQLEDQGYSCVVRFVGASARSVSMRGLLSSICEGISLTAEPMQTPKSYEGMDLQSLSKIFNQKLAELAEKGKTLILLIDALDQLVDNENLLWIPEYLPSQLKLVITSLEGHYIDNLKSIYKKKPYYMPALSSHEGEIVLNKWLEYEQRTLSTLQRSYVMALFQNVGTPLYLRLAFDEASRWSSTCIPKLASDVSGIICEFIDNLYQISHHNVLVVERSLAYLCAGRYGMTEKELLDVLSDDPEVMKAIKNEFHQLNLQNKLPIVIWARLRAELKPYLMIRNLQDVEVICFFHRQIQQVAEKKLKDNSHHFHLAKYFDSQPLTLGGQIKIYNQRKLVELPYQLFQAGNLERLIQVMDQSFITAKINSGMGFECLDEISHLYQHIINQKLLNLKVESLIFSLIDALVSLGNVDSDILSVEDVHANFIYRENLCFYKAFLKTGSENRWLKLNQTEHSKNIQLCYQQAFMARHGNMLRRDNDLKGATKVIQKVLSQLIATAQPDQAECSRIEYDLGYINYLRGEFCEAANWLEKSANRADNNGNKIGGSISRCVEFRIRWFDDSISTNDYVTQLDIALQIFQDESDRSPTAKRWIMNIWAHKFEIAYRYKILSDAEAAFKNIEQNRWLKSERGPKELLPYQARLACLKKNSQAAVAYWQDYFFERDIDIESNREAAARDYYDFGIALRQAGDEIKAKNIWQHALGFPSDPGNHYWHAAINKALV